MPQRMNMQSGRKHKSKLDIWENQWSGSLAAPLIFCYPLTKYFEMSEDCNNSACFRVAFWRTSDVSVTVAFYNDSINKETCLPSGRKEKPLLRRPIRRFPTGNAPPQKDTPVVSGCSDFEDELYYVGKEHVASIYRTIGLQPIGRFLSFCVDSAANQKYLSDKFCFTNLVSGY